MKRHRIAETDLAAAVVEHFRSIPGVEVYQEVVFRRPRADIVARDARGVLHVVECKVSFGLAVIEQAASWREQAHRVSIATHGLTEWDRASAFQKRLLTGLGVGWFQVVRRPGFSAQLDTWLCREVVTPEFRRHAGRGLSSTLCPEHQTFAAAGNAEGRFWSPWRATCKALAEFVAKNPGCTVRAAVAGIKHHYQRDATARSSLSHWIHAGKVEGVERREGQPGLWPAKAEVTA